MQQLVLDMGLAPRPSPVSEAEACVLEVVRCLGLSPAEAIRRLQAQPAPGGPMRVVAVIDRSPDAGSVAEIDPNGEDKPVASGAGGPARNWR